MRANFSLSLIIALIVASPAQALDLNGFRKQNGLKPLSQNATLTTLAKAHAADMARRQTLDHAGFYAARVPRGAAAENVSYGCSNLSCAIQQWIDSPPHRENMLRLNLKRYGLGSAMSASGQRYWAMELGR
jgi:uncharacterized protein YkwD